MSAHTRLAELPKRPGETAGTMSLAYLARSAVRRRLAGLERGRVDVHDPWGSWRAGTATEPAAVLKVNDPRAYVDLLTGGSLGAAEAYMPGEILARPTALHVRLGGAEAAAREQIDVGSRIIHLQHGGRLRGRAGAPTRETAAGATSASTTISATSCSRSFSTRP